MIALAKNLLERSPEETSRILLLGLLQQADSAVERLEKAQDEEALHDFRVALRRLRSLARCYRPYLRGAVKRKQRSRLKELAASTSAARDSEVQIAWLSREAQELDPEVRSGAAHLVERLRARPSSMPSAESLRANFDALHESLRKSLVRLRLRLDGEAGSFLSATGRILQESARELNETLHGVHSPEQGEVLHRARIEAKRLRYLLEPLQKEVTAVRALVKEVKSLQDALGELQDTRVLMQSISEELERAALEEARRLRDLAMQGSLPDAEPARAHPELLALLASQRQRRERRFRELERSWLSAGSEAFFRELEKLSSRLAGSAEPAAPPRKFLLAAVPEAARKKPPQVLRQGFVPGRRIREQVVSFRGGGRTRHVRIATVENGSSIEESLSREDFERFWRLCAGRRLERLRYEVREADRSVWIDEVREKGLILAELSGAADGSIPDWLRPAVLREVTGSRKFDWEAVARRPPAES